MQWLTTWVTQPAATMFLRLIFMLVIPLLFSALVVGIAEMGDVRALGRIGWRTLAYTVVVSAIAVVLGLVLVNLFKPGAGVDPALAQQLLSRGQRSRAGHRQPARRRSRKRPRHAAVDRARQRRSRPRPSNDHPGGDVLRVDARHRPGAHAQRERPTSLKRGIEGLFEVSMTLIGLVIRLAPYAVFCLMFNLAALFGWDLLAKLGAYVGVVVLALALHLFVVYSVAAEVRRRLVAGARSSAACRKRW